MHNFANYNRFSKVGANSFTLGDKTQLGSYLLFSRLSDQLILTCVIDYVTTFKLTLPNNITLKQAMNKANAMLKIFNAETVTLN